MWFLEHESLFGGKRVWLRPGSQQLFGRTKSADKDAPEGKTWKIDYKTISRKHVMLKVYNVEPEDGTKLHKRSQIEVTDLSCRQGTTIDGKISLKSKKAEDGTMTYSSETLQGTEHIIRLAEGYAPFKIVWQPTVFTYASKESRESKARSAQLHALDIKTTSDFQFDKTTHVVSAKRNLPKVLSGLTSGKHIVSTDFLDTVLNVATTSLNEEGSYVPSKLEEDFDTWWPAEKEYIPAAGAEPVARPQEMLEPDSARLEVFSGLTFVFLNEGQYSSLLDPVTGGGGKALLYHVRPGETTVEEYVDYVHSVAGKKRRGHSTGKLSVITVRLPAYPDAMEEWAASFVTGVDQALAQRSILQNEFLDVIITKDRTPLQRPPAEVVGIPYTAPEPEPASARRSLREPTPMSESRAPSQGPEDSAPAAEEPPKINPRKRIHRPKTSRFTGFDDFEPPPKKKKAETTQMEDAQQSAPQAAASTAASQAHTSPDTQSRTVPHPYVQNSVEKEELMDSRFPTAAKMRKQRAAIRAPPVPLEPEAEGPVQKSTTKGVDALARLNKAKARAEKEINIREHTRQRIKEEEDRRKADEESLREALEGVDITELKNLAKVEEMDVLPRHSRTNTRNQNPAHSERWDAAWNGRKNFKKFRRRGAEHGVPAHKVIVTLEEAAPKKGFGIGDPFFLEDAEPSSHSRRSRGQRDDSSEPEPGGFTRRNRTHEVVDVVDSGPDDEEEEEVSRERTQKSSGRTQRVVETQVRTQSQRGKKRGSGAASGQPASKKGRLVRRDDDSDDEETGFRFKRRAG
ncbi:DNA damage response protein RcaA [Decorospora gaudefroyi]|uniref:DNA damage response protein RcaA n=1 Tax=Decorospora gaudefroyi TaxID=184978 RepID=A0A6A5KDT2_9PLEO|nr:DNA damage response protein RcaA [Decorospora gaudefroyi]